MAFNRELKGHNIAIFKGKHCCCWRGSFVIFVKPAGNKVHSKINKTFGHAELFWQISFQKRYRNTETWLKTSITHFLLLPGINIFPFCIVFSLYITPYVHTIAYHLHFFVQKYGCLKTLTVEGLERDNFFFPEEFRPKVTQMRCCETHSHCRKQAVSSQALRKEETNLQTHY